MELKLIKKVVEAKGTVSFFWKPEKKVDYLPGQYYYYTLPKLNYPEPRGATRQFTIASSPTEGEIIQLTTRIREQSGFKKTLNEIKIGEDIDGEGPSGTFILDTERKNPQVFLAGGIGITPFRSFIKFAIDKGFKTPIYLIYSNSLPEEIAYRKELYKLVTENPNINSVFTVTKPQESKEKWTGFTGRVDEKFLLKVLSMWKVDPKICDYWLCGPPGMVQALETTLETMIVAENHIFSEKFTGY